MANRFWVGGSGTWDNSDTTHWASTSGGTGGASAPISADAVTLDASSGSATVTLGADVSCLTFTSSSALNTLDMSNHTINLYQTTNSTIWNWTGGSLTSTNSTINIASASSVGRLITGGGKTYGTIQYNVANSQGYLSIFDGSNTADYTIGSGRAIYFKNGVTNTIRSMTGTGTNYGYIRFGGATGEYWSVPDSAALSITGDLDIRCYYAADNWSTSSNLVGKFTSVGSQGSYYLGLNGSGNLVLYTSSNGSTVTTSTSSTTTGFTNGTGHWIRATYQQSSKDVKFWTSNDPASTTSPTWSQLGTTQAASGAASIFDSTVALTIGGSSAGSVAQPTGNIYRCQVRNNILDDGTGIQADIDFTTKTLGANSFTEGSANAATCSILATGYNLMGGDGRLMVGSASSGSTATISKSSGTVSLNYTGIRDVTATGGATWYAGAVSSNISNNSGWTFSGAPSATNSNMLLAF